jgi:chromosome segregation ATPase
VLIKADFVKDTVGSMKNSGTTGSGADMRADIRKQYEEQDKALTELRTMNSTLIARVGELRGTTDLNEEARRILSGVDEEAARIHADNKSLAVLTVELEAVQRRQGQHTEGDDGVKNRLNEILTEVESLRGSVYSSQRKVQDLEGALVKERAARNHVTEEANRKLAKIADANWEKDLRLAEMEKNEGELKKNIAAQQDIARTAAQELEMAKADLVASQAEREKMKNQFEIEIRQKESQLDRGVDLKVLNNIKHQYNQEIERLRNTYRQEVLVIKTERSAAQSELSAAYDEIEALKKEALQSQANLHHAKIDAERSIIAVRSDLNQSINAKELRIQEIEAQKASFEKEIKRLSNSEARLKAEMERAEDRFRMSEASLRGESSKYQSEYLRISGLLASTSEQLGIIRAEKAVLVKEVAKLAEVTQALNAKTIRVQELEGRVEAGRKEVERAQESERLMKEDFDAATDRFRAVESEIRAETLKYQSESSRLAAQLASADQEIERLASSEKKLRADLEKMEERQRAMEEKWRAEVVKYQTESSRFSVQLASSVEQISGLRFEKEKLEKELEKSSAIIANLNHRVAKLQDYEIQYEASGREISRLIEVEQNLKAELAGTEDRFREMETNLREKLHKFQSEASRFSASLNLANEQLMLMKSERENLEKTVGNQGQLQDVLNTKERRIKELEGIIESHEHEIERLSAIESRLQNEIDRSSDRFRATEDALRADAQKYQNEIARLSTNFANISEQVTALKAEKDTYEAQIERANEQIEALTAKSMKIHEIEAEKEALEQDLKRQTTVEHKLRSQIELSEEKFRTNENNLRGEISKIQVENAGLSIQLGTTKEQIVALRTEKATLESELRKANEATQSLRDLAYSRQEETHEAKEIASRNLRDVEAKMGAEIAAGQKRLSAAEARVREAQSQIHQMEIQIVEAQKIADDYEIKWKKIMAERDAEVKEAQEACDAKVAEALAEKERVIQTQTAAEKALAEKEMELSSKFAEARERNAQMTLRENQLKIYANNLSKEKAEIQKVAKGFVKEIRLLSSTHPLKDYLSVTEFEISKVEVQLSTTPTLSAERAKIEAGLKKLIQQRDFLKTILADSQKQFETQAAGIEKLLSSGVLMPVPPPPPVSRMAKQPGSSELENGSRTGETVEKLQWERPIGDIT